MRMEFIDPGRLRDELSVETVLPLPDGIGGYAETWTEQRTVFGRIEPVAQRPVTYSDRAEAVLTHRIWLRAPSAIDGTMRLRKGARVFRVLTVADPDGSGRYAVVTVEEQGA